MVLDVITFNEEHDLLDIRLHILKEYVNNFIIVEFDKTFSGNPKSKTFDITKYPEFQDKISYFYHTESDYMKYMPLAIRSPQTRGADHWKREFCQKESIKDTLQGCDDEDTLFIGDCDEIWDPDYLFNVDSVLKLKLRVYTYYLNNRSSEDFYGTIVGKYKNIKDKCLNHLRTQSYKTEDYYGWHFTSLKDNLRQKLLDSYTKETYANDTVMNRLDDSMASIKDFLGRDFTYKIDESDWPPWLSQNKEHYKHLLRTQ